MYDSLTLFGTRYDTEWTFCSKVGCVYEIECILHSCQGVQCMLESQGGELQMCVWEGGGGEEAIKSNYENGNLTGLK